MAKKTITTHIADFLNERFPLYEDVLHREANIQQIAYDLNQQFQLSGNDQWDSTQVKNYYYRYATKLRNEECKQTIEKSQIPNIIYHNNSPCYFVRSYKTENEIHCYYRCKRCGTNIPTKLMSDKKVEPLQQNIHRYCVEQSQKSSNQMTELFINGVTKAQSLLQTNKALGRYTCIDTLIKEMPLLKHDIKLADTIVGAAFKEVRKVGFVESILQSSIEYKTINDSTLLYIMLFPRHTIAFCSQEQKKLLQKSKILFVDGTFDETSPEFKKGQLLNFLTINDEGYPLPLIHILMTQRNGETYIKTFEDLKHFVKRIHSFRLVSFNFESFISIH